MKMSMAKILRKFDVSARIMFVECSDQGAKLLASVRPVISQVAELARA